MNRTTWIILALCMTGVTQVQAFHMSWAVDLIDNENAWNYQPGLVQLYTADNQLVNQDAGSDVLNQAATFHQNKIGGNGGYNWLAGQQFYFKVYNATTEEAATRLITTAFFSMPDFASSGAAGLLAVAIEEALTTDGNEYITITLDDKRWTHYPAQVLDVPEPASQALYVLVVGMLALRRQRFSLWKSGGGA